MSRVVYDEVAARYQAARGMSLEAIEPLRDAVRPWLAAAGDGPLLDLGAGTGQFARPLAVWLGRRVLAVEPSHAMRAQALSVNAHPLVSYLGGRAEELPLASASCAAAWLSTVIHHFTDLDAAAHELRRVLHRGGPVLVHSAFPGRTDGITLFRFFPGARRALARFPSVERVGEAFTGAGFQLLDEVEVAQTSASSLQDFAERVRGARHADSTLVVLDDDEFARGMTELDRAGAREVAPRPVVDRLTLLLVR